MLASRDDTLEAYTTLDDVHTLRAIDFLGEKVIPAFS
jgi:hypothetical protein